MTQKIESMTLGEEERKSPKQEHILIVHKYIPYRQSKNRTKTVNSFKKQQKQRRNRCKRRKEKWKTRQSIDY